MTQVCFASDAPFRFDVPQTGDFKDPMPPSVGYLEIRVVFCTTCLMGLLSPPPKPRAVIRSGRGQPKTGHLRNLCIFQEALCGETSEVVEFLGDEAISSLGGEACNCRECSSDDVR